MRERDRERKRGRLRRRKKKMEDAGCISLIAVYFECFATRIKYMYCYLFFHAAHFGDPAGIVGHRAEAVHGEASSEGGKHAKRCQSHAVAVWWWYG